MLTLAGEQLQFKPGNPKGAHNYKEVATRLS